MYGNYQGEGRPRILSRARPTTGGSETTALSPATSIDGNAVAAANDVDVKSVNVKISKLHPKMGAVIVTVAQVAKILNLPKPVITSGNDSIHKKDSLHYQDRALDFRGNNIEVPVGQRFRDEVAGRLGNEYDALFETFKDPIYNHLHVEFEPG